jgi:hypothetical protein
MPVDGRPGSDSLAPRAVPRNSSPALTEATAMPTIGTVIAQALRRTADTGTGLPSVADSERSRLPQSSIFGSTPIAR